MQFSEGGLDIMGSRTAKTIQNDRAEWGTSPNSNCPDHHANPSGRRKGASDCLKVCQEKKGKFRK
ncbi:MAG: hypothetical protein WCK86_08575, partial [Planctomycetia bacterium]